MVHFQPSPLIAKIDPALIADMKKRFAGTQASRNSPVKPTAKANPAEAERLTQEVKVQVCKNFGYSLVSRLHLTNADM